MNKSAQQGKEPAAEAVQRQAAFDASAAPVAVFDAAGHCVLMNRACAALTGLDPEPGPNTKISTTISSWPPASTAPDTWRHWHSALVQDEEVQPLESAWQSGTGVWHDFRWHGAALPDAAGRVIATVVTGADMAECKRVEAELGESLDRYQAILDTAVDGIITIDERGIIQSFNHAAERIFGHRAHHVIGKNVTILMPSPHREAHDGYIRNYLRTRQKKIIGIGREVVGLRKDGTTFPLELAVGEVILPGRRLFTGVTRDISDRRNAELEARKRLNELAHVMRLRSMGDLASGLAHEVNQPLTAIISHAQACTRLLARGNADESLLRESLAQIAEQGERAGEIIRRLRKYVQKGEIEVRSGYLNAGAREVLRLLDQELRAHQVRVETHLDDGLPQVEMDRVQIEQVIFNLVRNAMEAMEAAPEDARELIVTTRSAHAGRCVEFEVRDRGPGLGPEIVQKLFQSYFTTKPQGLGQGLSICRTIVEAHGGRIEGENHPDGGAVFRFRLPVSGKS